MNKQTKKRNVSLKVGEGNPGFPSEGRLRLFSNPTLCESFTAFSRFVSSFLSLFHSFFIKRTKSSLCSSQWSRRPSQPSHCFMSFLNLHRNEHISGYVWNWGMFETNTGVGLKLTLEYWDFSWPLHSFPPRYCQHPSIGSFPKTFLIRLPGI